LRGIWIRRLIPASVVAVVLAFSYFAPALGVDVAPVKSHNQGDNCGRFSYGYRDHGGKHEFPCPSHSPETAGPEVAHPDGAQGTSQVNTKGPAVSSQSPASPAANLASNPQAASVPAPATKTVVVGGPVSVGVNQWRGFTELVLRQLG
jgi:hypothetical protein